ncbi:glycosyltransferase family 2 protein [Winogradskyella alexanderae]|uniref:Glycosyltransferase family 2 protein n=1 Tax=Winogradskyella alexanderae TaxID=2877123 RepID=A0ABS7XT66_9FLAO|nr:glycosyltransferase family 2 protein [Winogradskyella alexanderae]MCA0133213.1 glycosyltransferase family 2 protein [Winogradskyella alexanderae]
MKYNTTDIAIVILNWNGKLLLEKFLPSIINFSEDANIYVADNASTDNSVAFLQTVYPNIQIIQNPINGGYAKGYNEALKDVSEPLLCLLNSDVEVTDNWLEAILFEFNKDKTLAIVQPKLLDFNNRQYFEYAGAAGGFIDKYGYPYCRGRLFKHIEKDIGQYDDNTDIFWASGACFFIKNKIFKSLGGFDEAYFAHMEEIDLCWRAFNLGYTTRFTGNSVVYHVGGATLKNTNPKKTYLNFRNSLFTLAKNTDKNLVGRILTRMLLDGLAGLRFLFILKPLFFLSVLKAHASFYANLSYILKQRQLLKKRSNYFQIKSIVWSYFFLGKKTF